MNSTFGIVERIFFVFLLMGSGVLAKKLKLVSDTGEKDLSLLFVDFIWPAMIFSSIVTTLSTEDILSNLVLPLLSVVIHITGFLVGLVICRLAGYSGDDKKIFLSHATMNNFLGMALPLVLLFIPGKGAALLAVANLGSIIIMWTLVVTIMAGNRGFLATLKNVFSPAMIAVIAGVVCVFSGAGRYIPGFIMDGISAVGVSTMFIGLFIAGLRIYALGRRALKLNRWNILLGLSRNVLIPCILFAFAFLLRGKVSRETLIIFLIVSIMPANINAITLAVKYDSSPNLAAEGVLFTHCMGLATMIVFIKLIEQVFLK